MKKLIFAILVVLMPISAWAIDTNVLAVVQDGYIRSTGTYFSFGGKATGDSPAFENRYISSYSAIGTAGLAMENSFSGAMEVKEQFEVQSGFGRFVTKAGTSTLINTPRETSGDGPQIIDGRLVRNAVGFGGVLQPGVVLTTFSTANGLIGKSEAEGIGQFKAGGIQQIESGSNEQPIKPPTVIEYKEAHWSFDGSFKVQVEIIFPK